MMFFQLLSTSLPSRVTSPRPVTTTRRICLSKHINRPKPVRAEPVEALYCATTPREEKGSPSTGSGQAVERRSALVLVDILDRVANRRDLLGGIVRNLDPELLLEGHNQLDDVETVRAEIIDEARVLGHLVRLDAEMFDDDLFHPIGSLAHGKLPPVFFFERSPSDAPPWLQVAPCDAQR